MGRVKDQDISGELANAFKPEKKSKLKPTAIASLIIGTIALIAGLVFLILRLTGGPAISDAEKLLSAKEWVLVSDANCDSSNEESAKNCEEGSGVIWKFTEIGKGSLTTNNHTNDYDFIWSIEDNKLKIETKWLYDLNNEYEYKFGSNGSTLTITDGERDFVFDKVEKEKEE